MPQLIENKDIRSQDCKDLLVAYTELCRSYQAIREFRARLLGLLPLASAGGIFLLLNNNTGSFSGSVTLIIVGVLGCLITIGLYIYERHNMERCHNLIRIGANWEKNGLHLNNGQFMMRVSNNQGKIVAGSRYMLAATLIYGAVFLGWLYVGLVGVLLVIV